MTKNASVVGMIVTSLAFALACASTPEEPEVAKHVSSIPGWIANTQIEGGFADAQCVKANAGMSILKSKATALARAGIAQQIETQVKVMDKTYQSLTEAAGGSVSGSTFESVSKQVTNQKLNGSVPVNLDYVEMPDGPNFCVRVELDPAATEGVYKAIVDASGRELSATDDRVLYQEFRAHKAQQELEMEAERH